MCVSAAVKGDTVEYTLESTGAQSVGWMAMGFGTLMTNAAMVIMWPNSDGSITLSQRRASAYALPAVDRNPPRIATVLADSSDITGNKPRMTYSVPANSDTTQSIVWAFGTRPPSSSAQDATFQQHLGMGTLALDLTKKLSSSSPATPPPPAKGLRPSQRIIVAHAVFCSIGFLLILPAGALLARFFRTFSHSWFKGHWILQFGIGGLIIFIGVMLGIGAVSSANSIHFDSIHKKWGIVIFALYLIQCSLGAVIHFVKPKTFVGRPPQNYLHAVLGLLIIGLAFFQVRTGYKKQWPASTGLADLPRGVDYVWYAWVVLLPLLYAGGLTLLRRQYKQEAASRRKASPAHYNEIGMSSLPMNGRF
jgi:hypothetical protein